MTSVALNERTADELEARATASGLTVDEFVRVLMNGPDATPASKLTWNEVEAILREHAHDGPSLPADFSRADIYFDHD